MIGAIACVALGTFGCAGKDPAVVAAIERNLSPQVRDSLKASKVRSVKRTIGGRIVYGCEDRSYEEVVAENSTLEYELLCRDFSEWRVDVMEASVDKDRESVDSAAAIVRGDIQKVLADIERRATIRNSWTEQSATAGRSK